MLWYLAYLVIYFVILFSIGIHYYKKVKTSEEYNISAWNEGYWNLVGTIISTFVGAAVFIGWLGMGYTVGISGYFKFALPTQIFSIALVYFFAKPLRRQRLITLGDLFSERYGKGAGLLPSFLSTVLYAVPVTALQLVGMSTVFKICFGIPITQGIILGAVLLVSFTVLGGLPATIFTDALQSIILIVGVLILLVASTFYAGGISEIIANTPATYLSPLGDVGIKGILLYAFSVGPFFLVWQTTWQRIFAAKDENIARKAGVTGISIVMLLSLVPFSIGIIARGFVPEGIQPDLIFSYVTAEVLPPWIGGIVFLGLFAAVLTGGTSYLMQGGSNLVNDFYHRMMVPDASNEKLMFVSRISVVIIGFFALLVALNITNIIAIYQWTLRMAGVMLVIPFLATMFWKGTTRKGALWSMALAAIATIAWPLFGSNLDAAIIGFPVSLFSLIIISLLTEHSASEEIKALYWETLNYANRKDMPEVGNVNDNTLSI